ncbi:hypothetical protein [Actinophytocola sp. NPDC049390]|uniref:hypothetical protein n=1 Tax=Actinophytocola sp. NPDC049390 TaxID=3363894 RepID=UPI003789E272
MSSSLRPEQLGHDDSAELPPVATPAQATSAFVNGHFPRRRWRVVGFSALAGFLLTVIWSASFVDGVIGDTTANAILGHDAKETAITGAAAGIVFAFVSGLAGTFTACNIAVFGTVAPMVGGAGGRWQRVLTTLRPILWLAVGMIVVSAVYGAVVGLVGTGMPQFDEAATRPGEIPGRLGQAMVVFGLIGLVMTYLGMASLGFVRDPFRRIAARFPNAPLVFMGALVGAFLIGRPFPLFRKLFRDAADSGNPLYGAGAFVLQSIGNIVVLAVLMLVIAFTSGRLQRWFAAEPRRLSVLTGAAMIIPGVFLVLYWDVRLPAMLDIIGWFPVAPWV